MALGRASLAMAVAVVMVVAEVAMGAAVTEEVEMEVAVMEEAAMDVAVTEAAATGAAVLPLPRREQGV